MRLVSVLLRSGFMFHVSGSRSLLELGTLNLEPARLLSLRALVNLEIAFLRDRVNLLREVTRHLKDLEVLKLSCLTHSSYGIQDSGYRIQLET